MQNVHPNARTRLLIGLLLLAAPASAQQLSTVTFTVMAADGACPVDGARISITDDPLGASATTDATGFAIVSLMKGTYSWEVSATDYDTATGTLTVSSLDGPSVDVTLTPTDRDSDECVGA